MIPKLNLAVLEKHEFTKLLHESYENEAPKITFIQNTNKEYKLKLHFLELIYESNEWHKTFIKGVKMLLSEATPLLKMCLIKDKSYKLIEKISFERLNRLLDTATNHNKSTITNESLNEDVNKFTTTSISLKEDINNPIKIFSGGLTPESNNKFAPIDYNSVNKQKFDFTENFVNFDISENDENEIPIIDLFSQTQKKIKIEDTKPIENEEDVKKEIIISGVKESVEIKNTESNNTGGYERKLIEFINENSVPMFLKQAKTLKKLHKCIVTFIDDFYESKFHLSPQKAEDDVFKQICDDYEL